MADVDLSEVERYLRIFQENPDSRVFAPLADMYRRLGRLREAEEICREGLLRHPYYAGGKVALAHILLESGQFEDALREAESVVTYYPDNLLARKILIRTLGALNRTDDARREFEALKHLAPMIAGDPEIERALQGRAAMTELPATPIAPSSTPQGIFKPIQIQERTEWDPRADQAGQSVAARDSEMARATPTAPLARSLDAFPLPEKAAPTASVSPAVQRSRRLAKLLRKKLAIEALLRKLESA